MKGLANEGIDQRLDRFAARVEDGFAAVTAQIAELRAATDCDSERLDKGFHGLSACLARLERKLDRVLALSTESRARYHP